MVAQMESNYLEKYHKGKRTKNHLARLDHRIEWYESMASSQWHGDWFTNHCRQRLRELRMERKEQFPEASSG